MNLAVFADIEAKLRSLPMDGIVERASDRQESLMEDLNVQQMEQGINSEGNRILPEYAPSTKAIKRKKSQPVDKVTLKDTGQFHSQVRVKRYPSKKELVSYDSKSEKLQTKYGPEILGLTDENMTIIKENMKPLMISDIRNLLKQ